MALYINDEQISVEKLAEKLRVDKSILARLKKKSNFRIDKSKILKKTTIVQGAQFAAKPKYGVKTTFWFTDPEDSLRKRLRYAESQANRVEGNVQRFEYSPGRLDLDGVCSFPNQLDKAFFMYLRPDNMHSPLYTKGAPKKFNYVDPIAEAKQESEEMGVLQEAFIHASQAQYSELVIVAKAIGALKNEDLEEAELRVRMQKFALNPATTKLYQRGMKDELLRIEGRIRHMIDNGMFTLKKSGSARQWIWARGEMEGTMLGEPIYNQNEDATQRLIVYLKSNLDKFLWHIDNSSKHIEADENARKVLEKVKVEAPAPSVEIPAHLAGINQPEPTLKEQLTEWKHFMAYVGDKGYPKTVQLVKEFQIAVQSGEVTNENVNGFLAKLFEK